MVLDPSCNPVSFLVERTPADSTTTHPVLPFISNLFSSGPINTGSLPLIPLTSQSSNTLSSTASQQTDNVLGSSQSLSSSQSFTTSSAMASQVRTIFHCLCPINDIGSFRSSLPSWGSCTLHPSPTCDINTFTTLLNIFLLHLFTIVFSSSTLHFHLECIILDGRCLFTSLLSLQSNIYPSNAGKGYLQETSTPSPTTVSTGSQPLSSSR
jgi:hypothetical protein